MACFCKSRYKFYRSQACRGTNLISETDLSRCNKCYKMGTGAVSRYKFDRSQKTVTVQDFNCGQVRVSGCKFWQDLSWEQGPDTQPKGAKHGVVFANPGKSFIEDGRVAVQF